MFVAAAVRKVRTVIARVISRDAGLAASSVVPQTDRAILPAAARHVLTATKEPRDELA